MKEKIKKEKKDHFAALSKITTMYAQNVELAYQQEGTVKVDDESNKSLYELYKEFNRLKVVEENAHQEVKVVNL